MQTLGLVLGFYRLAPPLPRMLGKFMSRFLHLSLRVLSAFPGAMQIHPNMIKVRSNGCLVTRATLVQLGKSYQVGLSAVSPSRCRGKQKLGIGRKVR